MSSGSSTTSEVRAFLKGIWPSLLTLLGIGVLALVVYETMNYLTNRLKMDHAYWIVPVFGALGGAIGGIWRSPNQLSLCTFKSASLVDLGVLADIALGLGGASTVVFLFGTALRLDPADHNSYVIIVSVSFIAGVSGKRMLELAARKLEDIASKKGAEAGAKAGAEAGEKVAADLKEEVLTGNAAAENLTQQARRKIDSGLFQEGLDLAEKAMQASPRYVDAYIEKGRALKRQMKPNDALSTIEKALQIEPKNPKLLYNRACYHCLLGKPADEVLHDLKEVGHIMPVLLYEDALKDSDFNPLADNPSFKELTKPPA
jgi:tetratricopeptide (TPR) repeat protein